jgi:stalled ribosome rescue protein Dom34
MSTNPDKIAYGPVYVVEANANQAVAALLITDTLFRSRNYAQRKIYNDVIN